MNVVDWKIEGMSCFNCAADITTYLQKQGMQDVKVNFLSGQTTFDNSAGVDIGQIKKGIHSLGFVVTGPEQNTSSKRPPFLSAHLHRFLFCLLFTIPLLLPMVGLSVGGWLMNQWVELVLCLPVYIVGMNYFGRSAWLSLKNRTTNMNVLIALGATASFFYSVAGILRGWGETNLFFETTAVIITLLFLGNHLEMITLHSTQRNLNKLVRSQHITATMIAFDDEHRELYFPVEASQLRNGDIILIKAGEQVPSDCKILWGDAEVDESIVTGESFPVARQKKALLTGGSIVLSGTVKAQVTASGNDTVLAKIISMIKNAQMEKAPMQQLADRISAVFVPLVLGIAVIAFFINDYFLHDPGTALMRSIAILVIACPCAMGLATPAAVSVGLGRAARHGILFRNTKSLELFNKISQVVFDKTGTLTTGTFTIAEYYFDESLLSEQEFKAIVYSLEKYSNHPLAKGIVAAWPHKAVLKWDKIEEIKGAGVRGETANGEVFFAGAMRAADQHNQPDKHNIYVSKNGVQIGWVDLTDELRKEAPTVLEYFQKRGIKTILLSGDSKERCNKFAASLAFNQIISGQSPSQKMDTIKRLAGIEPTAMIGDGINDGPALAKATIGISMSDASHVAMSAADVVLLGGGIEKLPLALGLGKHTFLTIRQNLFWAFVYNVVAIPIAACGLLSAPFAALVMGLSDVVLAANALRLYVKRVL